MDKRSATNSKCAMRRIALLISLMLIGCSTNTPNEHIVTGDVSIAYIRSLADARSSKIKQDVWIEGTVVLNDKLCESYKSFVLYDGTAGIEINIDAESIDVVIPLYSHVRVRCEGLHLGREGARIALGAAPTGEYTVDRISESEIFNYMEVDLTKPIQRPEHRQIEDIDFEDALDFIRIDSVWVIEEHRSSMWGDDDAKDRPYDSSLRYFTDGHDTITVATLNRCHYITEHIPDGMVSLFGVVDSYDRKVVLRLNSHPVVKE